MGKKSSKRSKPGLLNAVSSSRQRRLANGGPTDPKPRKTWRDVAAANREGELVRNRALTDAARYRALLKMGHLHPRTLPDPSGQNIDERESYPYFARLLGLGAVGLQPDDAEWFRNNTNRWAYSPYVRDQTPEGWTGYERDNDKLTPSVPPSDTVVINPPEGWLDQNFNQRFREEQRRIEAYLQSEAFRQNLQVPEHLIDAEITNNNGPISRQKAREIIRNRFIEERLNDLRAPFQYDIRNRNGLRGSSVQAYWDDETSTMAFQSSVPDKGALIEEIAHKSNMDSWGRLNENRERDPRMVAIDNDLTARNYRNLPPNSAIAPFDKYNKPMSEDYRQYMSIEPERRAKAYTTRRMVELNLGFPVTQEWTPLQRTFVDMDLAQNRTRDMQNTYSNDEFTTRQTRYPDNVHHYNDLYMSQGDNPDRTGTTRSNYRTPLWMPPQPYALGGTIGSAIGAASNFILPGLGAILSPTLSAIGNNLDQRKAQLDATRKQYTQLSTNNNPYGYANGGPITPESTAVRAPRIQYARPTEPYHRDKPFVRGMQKLIHGEDTYTPLLDSANRLIQILNEKRGAGTTSFTPVETPMWMPQMAEGGSINIKPENKGKFTAAAKSRGKGVQEFAKQVLANPDNYSPTMRKRANFARNASKWQHALGGALQGAHDLATYQGPSHAGGGIPINAKGMPSSSANAEVEGKETLYTVKGDKPYVFSEQLTI